MSINFILTTAYTFLVEQSLQNKEFDRRAEEAKKLYWDACKLPRKQKKRVRKEAFRTYNFYKFIQTW